MMLPFNPSELTAIRVTKAQFARMCGVSRQAVTKWVQRGYFSVGPDDRFDPAHAFRCVVDRADPARLRARMLKKAFEPLSALRARVEELESDLAEARRHAECARLAEADRAAARVARLSDALLERFAEAEAAQASGHLDRWLDELVAVEVYEWDLDDYRAEVDGDLAQHDDEDQANA